VKKKRPVMSVYLFYFPFSNGRGISFSLQLLSFFCPLYFLRWRRRLWGFMRGLPVYGVPLLDQRKFLAKTRLEQETYLIKQLKQVKNQGGVVAGLPLACRDILPKLVPVPVADGRPLAMAALLEEVEAELSGFNGKEIALTHLDDTWSIGAADYLCAAGAWVSLQGARAKDVSAKLYREKGIALPVLSRPDCYTISLAQGEDIPGRSWHLKETLVAVPGIWYDKCSFPHGFLPTGLAAAVWQVATGAF